MLGLVVGLGLHFTTTDDMRTEASGSQSKESIGGRFGHRAEVDSAVIAQSDGAKIITLASSHTGDLIDVLPTGVVERRR